MAVLAISRFADLPICGFVDEEITKLMKYELQDIICGTGKVSYGNTIKAAASYLRGSQSASRMAQKDKPHKREETERLCKWIEAEKLYKILFGMTKLANK